MFKVFRQKQHIQPLYSAKNRIDHSSAQTENEGWQATKQEIQVEPLLTKLVIHEVEIRMVQETVQAQGIFKIFPQTSGKDLYPVYP